MFSRKYIQECIENAEKLREECQLTVGDWVYLQSLGLAALVVGVDVGPDPETFALSLSHDEIGHFENEGRTLIPLPTPRQLWGMIKERGFSVVVRDEPDGCNCEVYNYKTEEHHHGDGPDPETALLLAWLEVMKDDTTLPHLPRPQQ